MKLRTSSINLFSPFVLAGASLAFFILCLLIPPNLYEALIPEQNHMFMDARAFVFFLSCVLSFCLGAAFKISANRTSSKETLLKPSAILVPLLCAASLNAVSVAILLQNNPWMFLGWFSDSARVKREYDATGGLSEALPLLFAVCWWAHARALHRKHAFGTSERFLQVMVALAAGFAIFTAMMKAARFDLIPGVLGFLLISNVYALKRSNLATLFKQGALLLSIVAVIFFMFAILRGAGDRTAAVESIAGYTIASYNRLSAVLEGTLTLPYEGTGGYSFTFLTHVPLIHNHFDFANALGMPPRADVRLTEFSAVSNAGLDDRFIWVSAFGFLYSDIGLWTPIYLLAIGFLTGAAWRSLNRRRAFGIVMYPWAAFNILFWLGSNYFVYPRLITFGAAAICLMTWEKLTRENFATQPSSQDRCPAR